jgi:hypothetical protein
VAAKIFNFNEDDYGSHVLGWPRGPITDEYLETRAILEGRPVVEVAAEAAAYKTPGGTLYTLTPHGREWLGKAGAKKVEKAAEEPPAPAATEESPEEQPTQKRGG